MRRMRFLSFVVVLVLGATLVSDAKESLPDLRRNLLNAHDPKQTGKALHALTLKIGTPGFFADHAAFADWLGTLPDGRADDLLVRRHRGWALVKAKRGGEAVPHLEAALKANPSDGLTRAWLADALRQDKRFMEAAVMLTAAVQCGEKGTYVDEMIHSIVFAYRRSQLSGHADDLPEYVLAARTYLGVKPDAKLQRLTARLLLDDFATFEKPDRTRGKSWARAAGELALHGITTSATVAGDVQLAYDAARALEVLDTQTKGKTLRYDLLAAAYRLGRDPNGGPNARPDVIVWLAECAAREGRFDLAYRLVQERLEISESPRAKRLLRKLPPDLGIEKD
jgi:tetratricopeptide (TPR) repeat protein